ncbi:MAG TPA: LytS/YhcK type 5TM receptor domain-containing protein, partial [Clostridia bacterium]|nr:LytS/YhcK type 5TM receptor domain-containing protein [Clostridia bacterium]
MNIRMIGEITYNISLLLALCSLFAIFPYNPLRVNYFNKVMKGLMVGLIGVGIMLNPFVLLEGLVFDVRSVLIVVAGMFFGLIPTIIGSIILIAFRIFEGG